MPLTLTPRQVGPLTLRVTATADGLRQEAAHTLTAQEARLTLTLTGPAGGTWSSGTDGERIDLDAVEFCRILSGRAPGTGLLVHQVPF